MENTGRLMKKLFSEIKDDIFNHQSLLELQRQILTLPETYFTSEPYFRNMSKLYQGSKHPKLCSQNDAGYMLGIQMKKVAMNMVTKVVDYIQQHGIATLEREKELKGLQIMVLSIRALITYENSKKKKINSQKVRILVKFQEYCRQLFSYFGQSVKSRLKKTYFLNQLQIISLCALVFEYNFGEGLKKIRIISDQINNFTTEQRDYWDCLIINIIKVMVERGKTEIGKFIRYIINEELRKEIEFCFTNKIMEVGKKDKKIYEILGKIQKQEQICEDELFSFFRNHFQPTFFQIIEENNCPFLLTKWLKLANKSIKDVPYMSQGLECFLSLWFSNYEQSFINCMVDACKEIILLLIFQKGEINNKLLL